MRSYVPDRCATSCMAVEIIDRRTMADTPTLTCSRVCVVCILPKAYVPLVSHTGEVIKR